VSDPGRLPAHLEVAGLVRAVQAAGGFATVLAKGEREAGTIMVVTCEKGTDFRAWERMPQVDGSRSWTCVREAEGEDGKDLANYLDRRKSQDSDLWIIELDVADGERFIPMKGSTG